MYKTLFDVFADQSHFLQRLPRWRDLQPRQKALIAALAIIVTTLLLGSTAAFTRLHRTPLVVLGMFLGVIVSRVLTQFLAPKIQSLAAGFLGGITTGNIASKEASLSKGISALADLVNKLAASIISKTQAPPADFSQTVTLCIWIAIVTALVILATNAYYANQESSTVGERVGNHAGAPGIMTSIAAAQPVPVQPY
jgi:hypothetical protein